MLSTILSTFSLPGLPKFWRQSHWEELAELIAERSLAGVQSRIGDHAYQMSGPQRRGYIWARAGKVVHREARTLLVGRHRVRPAAWTELIRLATGQVVDLAESQLDRPATSPLRLHRAA